MSSRNRLRALKVKERRDLLIQSVRTHLLPVLIEQGFEVVPLVTRGPVDREFVLTLPLGRLRRMREGEVADLVFRLALAISIAETG